jgi:phosphatidylglycerol lysyltransferase
MGGMDFGVLAKNGKICGFCALCQSKDKHEISSDVVRYTDCGAEMFAYMLYQNVLWAKGSGYKLFDLGLSYVADSENENGVLKYFAKMFSFAEHFGYNLKELEEFKGKFNPKWDKRYIAIHPDKYIAAFIRNFTSLISPNPSAGKIQFFRRFFKR